MTTRYYVPAFIPRKGGRYTMTEILDVLELRYRGWSWEQIARSIGRSADSVRSFARRRGLH